MPVPRLRKIYYLIEIAYPIMTYLHKNSLCNDEVQPSQEACTENLVLRGDTGPSCPPSENLPSAKAKGKHGRVDKSTPSRWVFNFHI